MNTYVTLNAFHVSFDQYKRSYSIKYLTLEWYLTTNQFLQFFSDEQICVLLNTKEYVE